MLRNKNNAFFVVTLLVHKIKVGEAAAYSKFWLKGGVVIFIHWESAYSRISVKNTSINFNSICSDSQTKETMTPSLKLSTDNSYYFPYKRISFYNS